MSDRLAVLLARPLRERERTRLFAVASLVLVLAAAALSVIAPPQSERSTPAPAEKSASVSSPQTLRPSAAPPAGVLRASRHFLSDYLAFLSGHPRARTFRAASASLAHRLTSRPPRVSPTIRRRRPHVVQLAGHRLPNRSRWVLTATVADGGALRYPIELVVATRQRGGAVVVRLGEV